MTYEMQLWPKHEPIPDGWSAIPLDLSNRANIRFAQHGVLIERRGGAHGVLPVEGNDCCGDNPLGGDAAATGPKLG